MFCSRTWWLHCIPPECASFVALIHPAYRPSLLFAKIYRAIMTIPPRVWHRSPLPGKKLALFVFPHHRCPGIFEVLLLLQSRFYWNLLEARFWRWPREQTYALDRVLREDAGAWSTSCKQRLCVVEYYHSHRAASVCTALAIRLLVKPAKWSMSCTSLHIALHSAPCARRVLQVPAVGPCASTWISNKNALDALADKRERTISGRWLSVHGQLQWEHGRSHLANLIKRREKR